VNNPQIFRPKSGYIFAGMALWIVATMLYLQIIDYGFNFGLIIASIWGALVCSICYQIFIHPKVVFFDEGVEIVNPFAHHLIGWQDVEQIDTRYTLSIKTLGNEVGTKQIYGRVDQSKYIGYRYQFNQNAFWINLTLLVAGSLLLIIHN